MEKLFSINKFVAVVLGLLLLEFGFVGKSRAESCPENRSALSVVEDGFVLKQFLQPPPPKVRPEPECWPISQQGVASFYGHKDGFTGRKTASGERMNPLGMKAAHKKLPFGTRLRVTNTENQKSVIVEINDRGPYIRGRIIDLSPVAAEALGLVEFKNGRVSGGPGTSPVKIEICRNRT